jgi:hypothetical protein
VTKVLLEKARAVGVRLASGEEIRAQKVVSNATRWDTFGGEASSSSPLVEAEDTPAAEQTWRRRYKPSPSFLSLHLGVRADVVPSGTHVHHLLLEDWASMEAEQGTVFVSMPTLLDPSLAPSGHHIVHTFTPSSMQSWQGLSPEAYRSKKQADAKRLIARLETFLPGIGAAITHQEVGTPRSHRRFLGRFSGSYGPIPALRLPGLLPMPFNRTGIEGLYCVGDSCFPGQGLTYQIGKTQIIKLLADTTIAKGREYSLREFHDYLWSNGNLPISLLRYELLGDNQDIQKVLGLGDARDVEEIWGNVRTMLDAYMSKDRSLADSFISEEVTLWDSEERDLIHTLVGLNQLRDRRPTAGDGPEILGIDNIKPMITIHGDLAIARYELHVRTPEGIHDEHIRNTAVWRRENGKWLCIHNHEDKLNL